MKQFGFGEPFDSLEAQVEEDKEATSAEIIEAKTQANESKTRSNLAYGAIAGGAVVISISAGMGFYDGSFDELQSVWNIAGPIVGGIFGHYFGGTGERNGNDTNS